jgi:hypothetical protein
VSRENFGFDASKHITTNELAKLFGVSTSTITRRLEDKTTTSFKVKWGGGGTGKGGYWINKEDLTALMQEPYWKKLAVSKGVRLNEKRPHDRPVNASTTNVTDQTAKNGEGVVLSRATAYITLTKNGIGADEAVKMIKAGLFD